MTRAAPTNRLYDVRLIEPFTVVATVGLAMLRFAGLAEMGRQRPNRRPLRRQTANIRQVVEGVGVSQRYLALAYASDTMVEALLSFHQRLLLRENAAIWKPK